MPTYRQLLRAVPTGSTRFKMSARLTNPRTMLLAITTASSTFEPACGRVLHRRASTRKGSRAFHRGWVSFRNRVSLHALHGAAPVIAEHQRCACAHTAAKRPARRQRMKGVPRSVSLEICYCIYGASVPTFAEFDELPDSRSTQLAFTGGVSLWRGGGSGGAGRRRIAFGTEWGWGQNREKLDGGRLRAEQSSSTARRIHEVNSLSDRAHLLSQRNAWPAT